MTTVSILSVSLAGAAKLLRPCISRKTYLPILQYVRFTATTYTSGHGSVVLQATDAEHYAEATLAAELDGPVDVLMTLDCATVALNYNNSVAQVDVTDARPNGANYLLMPVSFTRR